jgi:putative ABC transport system permease protein
MKYLPLVWAALRRKPTRAILTLLSVTVAFTLFGLMVGLSTTFDLVAERARADRIYTGPRYGGTPMPVAVARQVAAMPGVKAVTALNFIGGYVQDPKNRTFVLMADDQAAKVFADWPITQEQWKIVRQDRTGIVMSRNQAERWHKKVGDTFTIISPSTPKADGTKTWTFKVLAIGAEFPEVSGGYNFGNYDYIDKARPLADQGKVSEIDLLANDPATSTEVAQRIDQAFANSATPLQTITEKMARATSNAFGGLDVKAVTRDIALAGMFMVLFLTANGIAQSVRERFAEFATLKTIGFSDGSVVMMVVLEAAVPCMFGAALGVAMAAFLARQIPALMPPGFSLPLPTMAPVVFAWAAASAAIVALASAMLPALRLARMDIATALSGRT